MQSLLKGSFIYGLGQVLNKTLSLLLLPFFTAYLSTQDYGITTVISLYTLVITSISTFGTGSVMGILYFKEESNTNRLKVVNTVIYFLIGTSILAMIITMVGIAPLNKLLFSSDEYYYYIIISTLTALLYVVTTPITLWMQFEQKALAFVTINTSLVLISLTLNIVAVMYLKLGISGYINMMFVSSVLNFLAYSFYFYYSGRSFSMNPALIKQVVKLGWPLTFSFFFLFVIQNNSKYFLQQYRGLSEVGIFAIGNNLGSVINIIISSFNSAYFPFFMNFSSRTEDAPAAISNVSEKYITVFCVLSTLTFLVAKPLVYTMVNSSFYDAFTIIGLISLGWIFSGMFILIQPGLYYIAKVHYISTVQALAALLSVVFSIILIPYIGLLGAAVSFLVGNFSMFLIMHIFNIRLKIQHYYRLINRKTLLNILISILMVVLYSLTHKNFGAIIFGGISIFTYIAIMSLLNKSDLILLKQYVQAKLPLKK